MKLLTFSVFIIISSLFTGSICLSSGNFNENYLISYFALSFLITYVGFRMKFKTQKRLKFFVLRKFILARNILQNVDDKINRYEQINETLLPIQEKSIRLWKLLLRDELSVISCSMVNKIRQVEKDNMVIILSPMNEQDFLMTIMDVDLTKSCLYEIRMGNKNSLNLIDLFDNENEKRMLMGQNEKRNTIQNDLDKLLKQQEEALRIQKKK